MSQPRQFYSELEKTLLIELVGKHKDVIENKKNDYKTIRQKTLAWEELAQEFNSQSGVTKRDSKQLKKCWENVKARAKKNLAKEKRRAKLTGGGPSCAQQEDEDAAVAAIIPNQIDSLSNPFDNDNYVADNTDNESDTSQASSTNAQNQQQKSSLVVEAALKDSGTTKPRISAAQEKCLKMQTSQHEAEMELLELQKANLLMQHKRKMEVLDAELGYWTSMTKAMKTTDEQQRRPNTRSKK